MVKNMTHSNMLKIYTARPSLPSGTMNKKSRERWSDYSKLMKGKRRTAIKFVLPNPTRVGGARDFYEGTVRGRFNLDEYWHDRKSVPRLSEQDLFIIAQFVGVLHPIGVLLFSVQ